MRKNRGNGLENGKKERGKSQVGLARGTEIASKPGEGRAGWRNEGPIKLLAAIHLAYEFKSNLSLLT